MKLRVACLVVFAACVGLGDALNFPSYIKACSRNDPKLEDCALKSGRDAIPHLVKGDKKYRIPNMLPLLIDKIIVDNGGSKSQAVGLQVTMSQVKIFGLDGIDVQKIKINLKEQKASLQATLPKVVLDMNYDINGRILLLPIKGHGPGNITIADLDLLYTFGWDFKKKNDGKEYIDVTSSGIDFKVKGVSIYLDDLFDGNKLLGDNMNKFMNENWEEVLKDIGPAIGETFAQVITSILNSISDLVPYDEVFPDLP